MKIIALETEIEGVVFENMDIILKDETLHVYNLYLSGSLREIYFTENKKAIIVLETKDKKTALKLIEKLPLVKSKKINFDVMELRPYTGFERLLN